MAPSTKRRTMTRTISVCAATTSIGSTSCSAFSICTSKPSSPYTPILGLIRSTPAFVHSIGDVAPRSRFRRASPKTGFRARSSSVTETSWSSEQSSPPWRLEEPETEMASAAAAPGATATATVMPSVRAGVKAATTVDLEGIISPEASTTDTIPFMGSPAAAVVDASSRPSSVSIPESNAEPKRTKRRGKEPELLEGDGLANTPKMVALVYASLGLNAVYLIQALSTITSPLQAFSTAAAAFVGLLIADLVSGVFHWSVDNYGDRNTPVFGTVIEAFQGHHASPWTITYRPFENNVHKIGYAVLPLLALLRLVNPGPEGVALGVFFLVNSLMSQEFHRYAHMVEPPPLVRTLQDNGVLLSRREHGQHHSSPFEDKYCIVNGYCNGTLDRLGVFRFLERVVYRLNGVEPIAWKLDPSLKQEALTTGWLPFDGREQQ